jgi:hypothetical protein
VQERLVAPDGREAGRLDDQGRYAADRRLDGERAADARAADRRERGRDGVLGGRRGGDAECERGREDEGFRNRNILSLSGWVERAARRWEGRRARGAVPGPGVAGLVTSFG